MENSHRIAFPVGQAPMEMPHRNLPMGRFPLERVQWKSPIGVPRKVGIFPKGEEGTIGEEKITSHTPSRPQRGRRIQV